MGDKLKVVNVSACRIPGLVDAKKKAKKNTVNDEKLGNNISRARTKVQEYAMCNDWNYFVTLTLDPAKYDRFDLSHWQHDLSEFLHNFNRRRNPEHKVKYLFIPELHKDGAWHMHGLIKGLSYSDLSVNENGHLDWTDYKKRFGFICFETPRNPDACANYILKYITKDLEKSVAIPGGHLYYISKGLKKPDLLYRGRAELSCPWDYEHPEGYCKIKTFDLNTDDYTNYIKLVDT